MVAAVAIVLTGCGATVAQPTGDGPWEVRTYGMTPSGVGCGDGWKFDLTRTTTIDPAGVSGKREAVAQHLVSEGFEVDGMDLESGEVASTDVIVREQGVYSLLTV